MFGKIKNRILLSALIFFPLLSYSLKLEDVSYRDGEFTLTFDSKVSAPSVNNNKIATNNIDYNILDINLKNTTISDSVAKNIDIDDNYYKNIVINNISNNNIGIYTYSQYGYTSKVTYNDNVIKINHVKTTVPKKISRLTKKQLTIVLDAGHGGHDSGARGFGRMEKEIALQVVQKIAKNLERDHKIILTRKDDTFISLSERPKIGNRNSADLFVSVHLNAGAATANGAEIFYFSKETNPYTSKLIEYEEKLDENQAKKVSLVNQILGDFFISKTKEKSANIADLILSKYVKSMKFRRRGVLGANFAVLRGSESASILIELGFITNESDSAVLASDSGQTKASIAIADAIRENFEE